jgi:hypothetical protein
MENSARHEPSVTSKVATASIARARAVDGAAINRSGIV